MTRTRALGLGLIILLALVGLASECCGGVPDSVARPGGPYLDLDWDDDLATVILKLSALPPPARFRIAELRQYDEEWRELRTSGQVYRTLMRINAADPRSVALKRYSFINMPLLNIAGLDSVSLVVERARLAGVSCRVHVRMGFSPGYYLRNRRACLMIDGATAYTPYFVERVTIVLEPADRNAAGWKFKALRDLHEGFYAGSPPDVWANIRADHIEAGSRTERFDVRSWVSRRFTREGDVYLETLVCTASRSDVANLDEEYVNYVRRLIDRSNLRTGLPTGRTGGVAAVLHHPRGRDAPDRVARSRLVSDPRIRSRAAPHAGPSTPRAAHLPGIRAGPRGETRTRHAPSWSQSS